MTTTSAFPWLSAGTLYRLFKYSIYGLLTANIFLFFHEEYLDSLQLYGTPFPGWNIIDAYSASIDTFAWVFLVLLFELETAVISEEKLQGNLKWVFMLLRSLSYLFIIYAFYGYCVQYEIFTSVVAFEIPDVCSLVGGDYSYVRVDNYEALTAEACVAMQGQELVRIAGSQIISTVSMMHAAAYLAMVDVINSGDWLIVVFLLEIEVWLQLKDKLTARVVLVGKFLKILLYSILFACAVYWGFNGDFLDFWDAFLWLVAFVFIEMNLFQRYTQHEGLKITSGS